MKRIITFLLTAAIVFSPLFSDVVKKDNGSPGGNVYTGSRAFFEESIVLKPIAPCLIDTISIYYSGEFAVKDTLWIVGFPTSGNLWPTQYVWSYNTLIEPIVFDYDGIPGWKHFDITETGLRSEGLDKIVLQHRLKPQGPWFTYDDDGRSSSYDSWVTDPFTPNPNFYNIVGTLFYYPPGDFMIRLSVRYDYPVEDNYVQLPPPYFKNVTSEVNLAGRGMSSVVDWNNDGWDDIVNAASFFQNNGNNSFTNLNEDLIITRGNTTWGDINNDGYKDIFVAKSWGNDKIYLNHGNDSYQDVTSTTTVINDYPTMTPIWLDYNNDSFLDLFIANNRSSDAQGRETYYPDQLWRNNGDLTFTNVRTESGINLGEPAANFDCYGATANDYNNDNLVDIFVANYRLARDNQYKNNGNSTFTDVASETGLKGTPTADPNYYGHGMGCQWGDFNNDGYMDLCVGNLAHTDSRGIFSNPSLIFKNNGPPNFDFEEVHKEMGLKFYEGNAGVLWADLNLDGYLDLWHGLYSGGVNHLYINQGPPDYFLKEVTMISGTVVDNPWTASSIDYDNDGDIDLLIYGALYRNDMKREGNWLQIRLSGSPENNVNMDAYGSRIYLYSGSEQFYRQHSGSAAGSKCSQNTDVIHFGIGESNKIDSLVIHYSNGEINRIADIEVNGIYKIPYMQEPEQLLLATPGLKSPEIYESNITRTVNCEWYETVGAENYEIQISLEKDFEKSILNETTAETSIELSELENNKTYFWRVKAINSNDSSNISSIWQFTLGQEKPNKIEMLAPSQNDVDVSIYTSFEWTEPEYICDYCYNNSFELEISLTQDFDSIEFYKSGIQTTNYQLNESLEAGKTYFARVRAVNENVAGDWSGTIEFETMPLPSSPQLIDPVDNEVDVNNKPKFQWDIIENADQYHIQTSEFPDFSELFFENDNVKSNSYKSLKDKFTSGTKYYWRVRAINDGGAGEWSETWSFTVEGTKPSVQERNGLNDIKVIPNPVDNILTIIDNNSSNLSIQIYNQCGFELYFDEVLQNEAIYHIDTSEMPNGIYHLFLKNDIYNRSIKIVVIH